MKLVFIYGPPAIGKLTIAKELSKITGFKIFHNHIVNEALDDILENKNSEYFRLSGNLKVKIIESAAKQKLKGLIFTMMHVRNKRQHIFPNRIKRVVEKNKGKVYFVRIDCDDKEIFKRVRKSSRKEFGKFSSEKDVKKFMKKYDIHTPLNFKNQLKIDNTKLSVKNVARQIKEYYKL